MATKSSFLPRLSLSRNDSPLLPYHNSQKPLRNKKSEYDLDDLSPRAEDSLLGGERGREPEVRIVQRARSPSMDMDDNFGPRPTSKPKQRVLFAGPPPPIAKSVLLYRDEEQRVASPSPSGSNDNRRPPPPISAARNAITSVLFDRSPPTARDDKPVAPYGPNSVWSNLQRREKALHKDLQELLNIQAAGLSAGLGRPPEPSPSPSPGPASETGSSSSRTGTNFGGRSARLPMDRSTAMGEVIPVRQPRSKKMGLRAARAALARTMALLADLKAEEEASLATALSARKRALAQLRRVSARRDGIADELRSLEDDDEEPLARELKSLGEEHSEVSDQISELEGQLTRLKTRRRGIEGRMEDLNNRRESGLSGYRGALKEADGQVAAILRQPPVRPLDMEAFQPSAGQDGGGDTESSSPGGAEFLRLRSERRTADMAKDWWEGEVGILEKRKIEVDKERTALDEGAGVWREAVQLVSDFEADLRRQMAGGEDGIGDGGKGKAREPTPEDRMRTQLGKMSAVITGLEQRLRIVEDKHWNLLVCAIGAELAAFQEAEHMTREGLRAAGIEVDDDITPRLGRSASDVPQDSNQNGRDGPDHGKLIDAREEDGDSDNDVPPDLLMAQDEHEGDSSGDAAREHEPDKEDSENEVPPEFLAEHQDGVD